MVREEPNIKDNARYPIGEAARILGISRVTLLSYVKQNRIKFEVSQKLNSIRKVFIGREIKKCWRMSI